MLDLRQQIAEINTFYIQHLANNVDKEEWNPGSPFTNTEDLSN